MQQVAHLGELVDGAAVFFLDVPSIARCLGVGGEHVAQLLDLRLCDDVWLHVNDPGDAFLTARLCLASVVVHILVLGQEVDELFQRHIDDAWLLPSCDPRLSSAKIEGLKEASLQLLGIILQGQLFVEQNRDGHLTVSRVLNVEDLQLSGHLAIVNRVL